MPGASPSAKSQPTFRFGVFEVDVEAGELRKGPQRLRLQDKPFQLLVALLENAGKVVTREELRSRLWSGDTFVEFDDNLNHAVRKLREKLGDSADNPQFVETLPRYGYRFIAPVERCATQETAAEVPIPGDQVRRRLVSGVIALLVALLLLASVVSWRSWRSASDAHPRIMLAVLPLDNLSSDPEQEFLANSLTEEIITELGRLNPNRLGVIARTSVMQFKSTKKTTSEIGQQLGVDYIVEGGARRADHRLRVNVQLIRVSDQTHVWAESYESDLGDVLAVERTMAEKTARTLSLELMPVTQQRLASRQTVSDEAHEAYMRGRFLMGRRTAEAFGQAHDYFQKAIELEPRYAEAYAGLAAAFMFLPNYQALPVAEAIPKAKAAALRALELDPSMPEARTILAQIHSEFEWDFASAEREFKQVLQDNPNFAPGHSGYAAYLWAMGRFDEGNTEMKKTLELAPLSLGTGVDVGRGYYFAHQYDRAIDQYKKVIELDPNFPTAHSMLGMALLEKHDYDRAIAELQTGMALAGGGQSIWLGYAYAVAGRRAEAQQELAGCLGRWNKKHTGGVCMALAYLGMGDKDQAFAWLEKEFQNHSSVIYMLKAYPYWDALRSDPRYNDLLRWAGLPL
jgi:TolB-like protein/DNA-binding winged helix-turn-helix (wHTH) protein/Tfp pilus assembly protein PilF